MLSERELGAWGERIAKWYLEKRGYKILEQNFQRKWGELDIVARKKEKIIFFEVKTRNIKNLKELEFFLPEDEISPKKIKQLQKMVQIYLAENNFPLNTSCQIDILAISLLPGFQKANIRHYKNTIKDRY